MLTALREALAALLCGVDTALREVLSLLVRAYRFFLSPWLGSACRFEPTCSAYALQALARHGGFTGARLTAWRLLRCHPGCAGGHDPVPDRPRGLFTSLLAGCHVPADDRIP